MKLYNYKDIVVIIQEMLPKFRRKSNIIMWIKNISNWDCYCWYQSSGLGKRIKLRIVDLGIGLIAMIEMYVCVSYK